MQKINHLAVWVLVVIHQLIPMVWYGALSDKWMALNNLTMKDIEASPSPMPYIVAIVTAIVFNYFLAWLFIKLNLSGAVNGLLFAALIFISCIALEVTTHNMFQMRPFELTLINMGHTFLNFCVSGLLLGLWVKK